MALTTQSISTLGKDADSTPECEVRLDSEGRGYLYIKKKVEEVKEEPVVKEIKVKKTNKRSRK